MSIQRIIDAFFQILILVYSLSSSSVYGAVLPKPKFVPMSNQQPNSAPVSTTDKGHPPLQDTIQEPKTLPKGQERANQKFGKSIIPICPKPIIPICPEPIKPICPKPIKPECPQYLVSALVKKEECVLVKKIKPEREINRGPLGAPPNKCLKDFKMYHIDFEPYSGQIFRDILQETVVQCCWEAFVDPNIHFLPASNLSSIIQDNLQERILNNDREKGDQLAHFIFPVLGNKKSTRIHGHFFVPLFSPPGGFYVTCKHRLDIGKLIEQCVELWPLLLMCVVMASIAGFIAWLCETRKNTEEFPRQFFRGWFEGTWWSFISMTTVGYGDKTPKSIAGRCFSVAWILAGIIVFNILAGELTSVIIEAKMPGRVSMAEQKVGTLDRTYENSLVVENGGILVHTAPALSNDTMKFYHLIKNLEQGEIDGFLLDKYAYRYFKDNLLTNIEDKGGMNLFLSKTMITDIPHSGEDVAYGVLIKYEKRYDYFRPMFESNRIVFQASMSQYLNQANRNTSSQRGAGLKSEDVHIEAFEGLDIGHFFVPVVIIVFFGILFEVYKRSRRQDAKGMVEVEKDTEEVDL